MAIDLQTLRNTYGLGNASVSISQLYSNNGYVPHYERGLVPGVGDEAVPASGTISLGNFVSAFDPSGTTTFGNVGSYTWTAPPDITNVTITYITPNGNATTQTTVTPNVSYPVLIGTAGNTSSFGNVTIPAFTAKVIQFTGNVANDLGLTLTVANPNGSFYSNVGATSANLHTGATAAGTILNVTTADTDGNLISAISMSAVDSGVLFYPVTSSFTNTGTNGVFTCSQPTQSGSNLVVNTNQTSNSFFTNVNVFSWTIYLNQVSGIVLSYHP
jgi:hypothetical protein